MAMSTNVPLVLASGSARRAELLASAGLQYQLRPADIDETPIEGEAPVDYVKRLATTKALAVARPGELVVGADTSVVIDATILGKPSDAGDAAAMLELLSGRSHEVLTGMALVLDDVVTAHVERTVVRMTDVTREQIDWYVSTGEPMDKAGSYAIQGGAACFVETIEGSVTNVIGLPLTQLIDLIVGLGIDVTSLRSGP
ncbi:MAG: septum formation protein Maf [Acidimicrobiales bacterium]|nr:septum formation protein Maf [Acidimicrobiales bacterium]